MQKVIIFNAPPRAGKDIAVRHCLSKFSNSSHHSFKTPLLQETWSAFGLEPAHIEYWKEMYDLPHIDGGWMKDRKMLYLNGQAFSMREALIHTSEVLVKPVKGADYFGFCVAEGLQEGLNLFSDGGFKEELQPIIEKVGVENVVVIRIHREGHTFEGDSRSYLTDVPCQTVDITNPMGIEGLEGDYQAYLSLVEDVVGDIVNA